jgi:hypothetical protein
VFWVISVYFNKRNTLPKFGTFVLGHPVYTAVPFIVSLSTAVLSHRQGAPARTYCTQGNETRTFCSTFDSQPHQSCCTGCSQGYITCINYLKPKIYSMLPPALTYRNSVFCPQCIYVLFVNLRTNSDYFLLLFIP